MISKNHPNRRAHNWLAYDISDRFLEKYLHLYQGVLYDLGAGDSPYKEFFLQYATQYVAVDWVGSFHKTKADIAADLNQPLPIDSAVADTVVSLSVLEHLCEPQTMLNEAIRTLTPGGGLVLQVPWQWWIHEPPYDFYRYTPYGLRYLLEKSGFADITIEAQAGFFSMLILKLNYFSQRLIRGPRIVRGGLILLFLCLMYIGQKLAPVLDRLDRNWALETSGYFVTARKP